MLEWKRCFEGSNCIWHYLKAMITETIIYSFWIWRLQTLPLTEGQWRRHFIYHQSINFAQLYIYRWINNILESDLHSHLWIDLLKYNTVQLISIFSCQTEIWILYWISISVVIHLIIQSFIANCGKNCLIEFWLFLE